ncbi:actin filament-associated protein 1-like 2 isoform X2 [Boleophthalmus pectinirostris]|nr:actin filament-associated protein 1-like 2 isoform X2 [Boleophthalmus pectinirostris]
MGREPFPLPPLPAAAIDTSESYYEEAQPYEEAVNDDGEAVSSSYESYDEEEVTKGKCPSAQHQWPSAEAPFELMRDSRICAFLWRKKWLGQWAKQLCVIRDDRLMCYKSSKEQTPLLDVSLLGCSVVYKEKQLKRKEHRLKIVPVGGETIVLGLQSREQTEQWLKVIQEISPRPSENGDSQHCASDSPRLICTKGELGDRYSVASESGSSTDSHTEAYENKDVKKKFQFSNLMNIGKKKALSLESPEKCIDTSGYLNVLVNSQWRTCWCLIKNGQLWFYQDKSKSKISQPAVSLEGCSVCPDPSPEHLYSFRIHSEGTQLTTLEAKTSADMGHWLGLLLSQTGSKTSPEDLTYDYVNAERISSIVSAAKTSLYLMQRRYSEPNTYMETPPSFSQNSEELYDDVASLADPEDVEETESLHNEDTPTEKDTSENSDTYESVKSTNGTAEDADSSIYLDLIPVRSFLHTSGKNSPAKDTVTVPEPIEEHKEPIEVSTPTPSETVPVLNEPNTPEEPSQTQVPSQSQEKTLKSSPQNQESLRRGTVGQISKSFLSPAAPGQSSTGHQSPQTPRAKNMNGAERPKTHSVGSHSTVEGKLGKNRTEADLRRYREERERLEREREEVRSSLAKLKKERSEVKEELTACQDPKQQAALETRLKQMDEASREAERRRVEVELQLVEVKENLKKAESGPFTLGTTLDLQDTSKTATLPPSVHLSTSSSSPYQTPKASNSTVSGDPASPVNSASVLKNRPASIMATKGKVLQKAKEWEKMSTT